MDSDNLLYTYIKMESGQIHVIPHYADIERHEYTRDCWCHPKNETVDKSGEKIWVHQVIQ